MVSTSDILIGGLVLVLLGVGATSLFRIRGPSDISQDTVEDPPIQPEKPALLTQVTNQINKLSRELFPPIESIQARQLRKRTTRKVFFAPPQFLTDFQILGIRRRVEGKLARGAPLGPMELGQASRLTLPERLRQSEQFKAIRTEKLDILQQLKDLRMTIIDTV